MSWEALLTTFVVVATPGTGVAFTLAAGLSRGARASLVAALGCTLGIVPHAVAAITGLAALLHTSALAFEVFRYLGVAYLVYIAIGMWRDGGALNLDEGQADRSVGQVILAAILVNLLNPKLTIFFFAFLPQFVDRDAPDALARMLALTAVFMLVTLAVFAIYGVAAAAVRQHVLRRPRVLLGLRRGFAAIFLALGARLALTER
jgi:threonine/homoserine/homoserine lactone efflux protein